MGLVGALELFHAGLCRGIGGKFLPALSGAFAQPWRPLQFQARAAWRRRTAAPNPCETRAACLFVGIRSIPADHILDLLWDMLWINALVLLILNPGVVEFCRKPTCARLIRGVQHLHD